MCKEFGVDPAAACVQFSFLFDEIKSVALNTSNPKRVKSNIESANVAIPDEFWDRMM